MASRSPAAAEPSLRVERRTRVRGLYVVVDPTVLQDRPDHSGPSDAVQVAEAALEGGARMIQLRDKRDKGYVLPLARALTRMCREHDALFIVNDHVDIAILVEADGVHLGQQDLPIIEARRLLPAEMIVGVSTALVEEALAAHEAGADYIAVGAMYPSSSKENTRPAGIETLRRVRERIQGRPLVAIGGINETNVAAVRAAGADAVAVISAVSGAPDVKAAAQRLALLLAN